MMRLRWTVLLVSGAFFVAACGSTVGGVARQDTGLAQDTGLTQDAGLTEDAGLPGGANGAGVTDDDLASGLPGTGSGTASSGSGSGVQRGQFGGSSAVASGSPGTAPEGTAEPIQIGLLLTDTAAFAAAAGVSVSYTQLYRDAAEAIVEEINAAGGVAGRELDVIVATVEFTAASWNSEFESGCQKFTRDNHVHAVIADGILYNQSFNGCLAKVGVPVLYLTGSGGHSIGDTTDLTDNPGIIGVTSVNVDRKIQSILNKAIAAGFLQSGSKLGIFVEECPYNLRAYDRTLAPILARADVTVSRQDIGCAQGGPGHGPGLAQLQSAVLRFRSENVDSVMFLTMFENGVIYYFAQGAEQQGWAPQYLLFHQQGAEGVIDAYPTSQLEKMRGFGGIPLSEVTHPPAPPPAQAAARDTCLAMAESHGVTASDLWEKYVVFDVCDGIQLLRAALTNARGQAGLPIVTGIEQIDTGFVSTLTFNGATRFGSGRHDAMELTAVSVYKAECHCFEYITPARPIT